ncbi:hypothetical protein V6N12_007914 [Hibiscus sabdariffa]|uniref:Uncharacterized protein n=1 Tax=Hibiscus sabdariffa TaxID=183260 RepID=A0ABR2A9K9_9ROSI
MAFLAGNAVPNSPSPQINCEKSLTTLALPRRSPHCRRSYSQAKAKGAEPRNLRKLVENGIQGVAELKQLYKEKLLTMEKDVDEVRKISRFIKGNIEELDRENLANRRSLDAEKEQV